MCRRMRRVSLCGAAMVWLLLVFLCADIFGWLDSAGVATEGREGVEDGYYAYQICGVGRRER